MQNSDLMITAITETKKKENNKKDDRIKLWKNSQNILWASTMFLRKEPKNLYEMAAEFS